MTVLVAYDGSDESMHALEMACTAFGDQPLLIAHVIKPFADNTEAGGYSKAQVENEWDHAESMLEEATSSFSDELDIETAVRYGRPVTQLLELADDPAVEHIVTGSRGRDGAKRLLLGSVAETIVRRAPVPVTVVRHPPKLEADSPPRILVPFDASEPAKAALSYAVAAYPDAEITAVYAMYPPSELAGSSKAESTAAVNDWDDHRDEQVREVLDAAIAHTDDDLQTDAVAGEPAPAIVRYAGDHDIDHIVMGSHCRDGLSRLVSGSVAETVVRRAPTSVTVVRGSAD